MLPPDEVRAALDRLLASQSFTNAERLSRFLRFAVERSLSGGGGDLKEYLIGTEVFDRSSDFDPRLDPIVRVEARRLRAKLREYYEGPGSADPVRITLPKGAYIASFERAGSTPGILQRSIPLQGRRWTWAALILVFAFAVAGVLATVLTPSPRTVTIVVIPSVADADQQNFADGLAEALSAELARNPQLRVIAWQRFAEYRQQHGGSPSVLVESAIRDLGAEGVLTLSIRRSAERRRVTAALMNPEKGWKLWAGEYERGLADEFSVQREIARSIAEELRGRISEIP